MEGKVWKSENFFPLLSSSKFNSNQRTINNNVEKCLKSIFSTFFWLLFPQVLLKVRKYLLFSLRFLEKRKLNLKESFDGGENRVFGRPFLGGLKTGANSSSSS